MDRKNRYDCIEAKKNLPPKMASMNTIESMETARTMKTR